MKPGRAPPRMQRLTDVEKKYQGAHTWSYHRTREISSATTSRKISDLSSGVSVS